MKRTVIRILLVPALSLQLAGAALFLAANSGAALAGYFEYVLAAAEQGNASAQFNLGVMYDKGKGVPQDYAAAMKWYRKAAEQGNANAQYNLGVMYANGEGVPQDYIQAHMWYNLAATNGDKNAIKNRDNIAQKMTPSQIEKAQRLAREWQPVASP